MAKSIDPEHARPDGVSDGVVAAVGKLTEALERVERARGHLFEFHQLIGGADLKVSQAAALFEEAGEKAQADLLRTKIIGRNVLHGRWTFQVIEEFDDGYYAEITAAENDARAAFTQGRRHVFEAEMKERLRTPGLEGHEPIP
jgi:hypothetical protein